MTLKSAIDYIDSIRPNAFTDEQKTMWINEIEGKVQSEILLFAPSQMISYSYQNDMDTELLAAPPHDNVYTSYLCAMLDFAHAEYNRYNNSMQLFNANFNEYMRWFAKHYRPADAVI